MLGDTEACNTLLRISLLCTGEAHTLMPRSPFAKLLGKVFGACGIEFNQDTWKANDSKKKLATPVKTKISSDSCTTIGAADPKKD